MATLPVLPAFLKKKLEKKAALTVVDVISFVVVISESFADAEPKQQMALLAIAQKLMDCLKENIVKPKSAAKAKKAKSIGTAYELKITLADIKPPIWRRIQVTDCTLLKLNKVIQACMGWEDCHMWLFEIGDEEYGDDVIDAGGDNDFASARKFKLSRFVQAGVKKFRYTYDMGDNWEHFIQVEKMLEIDPQAKYPLCLDGERACPPEDCGGTMGYFEYLAAIADPQHEQHEELLEWRGPFDPEAFDIETVNKELATLR